MKSIPYLERTLENNFPELKPYLRPGVKVLDIGCGPGNLTIGVAQAIYPGTVVGLDVKQERIEQAATLASQEETDNVSFEVGDVHNLKYADESFDVVYSHTAFHSFVDPLQALAEQRRVTTKGGWVIAAGVRDWGLVNRYPACPYWDMAWDAWARHDEALLNRYRSGEEVDLVIRAHAGRMCHGWFREAGLTDLKVLVKAYKVQYSGAEGMEPMAHDLLPSDAMDNYGHVAAVTNRWKQIIDDGFLDEATLARACEERDAWYTDPDAFGFYAFVLVAGKV
jgi:SAM-dependent methyltransferase